MPWFGFSTYINDKKVSKQMVSDFKQVFKGEVGDRVLTAILKDLHYFGEAVSDEDRILQNAAKRVLYRFGTYKEGNELKIAKFYKGERV